MAVKISREDLLKSLSKIQSVADRRSATPILGNVRLDYNVANKLRLTVVDMEMSVKDEIKAEVSEDGAMTVSVQLLYEIIRKLPANSYVDFQQEGSQLELQAGSSKFSLPSLPVSDFPNFEMVDVKHSFLLNGADLKTILERTKYAVLVDDNRYYLCGCCLHHLTQHDRDFLCSAATDTHRLAVAKCEIPKGVDNFGEVIIPRKFAYEVCKLLEQYTGDVEVQISKNRILLVIGSITVISRLIDGKFPDYQRVIPNNNEWTIIVDKKKLMEAIDLVISVSLDKNKTVEFYVEGQQLKIFASSDLRGNASGVQFLPARSTIDNFKILFNARYLMDILNSLSGDEVQIAVNHEVCPTIFTDPADPLVLYVLMPVQTE